MEGEIFRTRPDGRWGPPSLLYNWYQVSFPGVKLLGCGVERLTPSSTKVKGKNFPPVGLHGAFYGTFTFTIMNVDVCVANSYQRMKS